MSNDALAQNFAAVIEQAASETPADTGETERYRQRAEAAGDASLVLADVSGSMSESAGTTSKYEVLQKALGYALSPTDTLIAFAATPERVAGPTELPRPSGGTALHLALGEAAGEHPARTLVISDGKPDDEEAAMEAARTCPGIINVIFCGPDDDTEAIAFLRRLAAVGGGRIIIRDLRQETGRRRLRSSVRGLLPS